MISSKIVDVHADSSTLNNLQHLSDNDQLIGDDSLVAAQEDELETDKYEGLEPISSDGYGAGDRPSGDLTSILAPSKPTPLGFIAGRLLMCADHAHTPIPFVLQSMSTVLTFLSNH
jgi:hypothetical protein